MNKSVPAESRNRSVQEYENESTAKIVLPLGLSAWSPSKKPELELASEENGLTMNMAKRKTQSVIRVLSNIPDGFSRSKGDDWRKSMFLSEI